MQHKYTDGDSGSHENDWTSYLEQHTPIPLDLHQALPLKLLDQDPVIDFSLVWTCPEDDCSYEVDFVRPPAHLQDWTSADDYDFLWQGKWDRQSFEFLRIFLDTFENHVHDHLKAKGIKRLAKMRHPNDYVTGEPRIETVELSEPGQATEELFDVSTLHCSLQIR